MKASVIIPTRNRADVLARCLSSLVTQTLAKTDFEVIVVDNGSTDSTQDVVRSFAGRLQLSCVFAAEPGLHVGRHAGLRQAQSPILIYGDDDIEALPTWVEAVVDVFEDARVGLVGGNNHPHFEADPPEWLVHWWSEPQSLGRTLGYLSVLDFGEGRFQIDPAYVWGCNFSVRRDALMAVGGFHPDGMPEARLRYRGDGESHVATAIRERGWLTMFDSRASVRHLVSRTRMTVAYFEQRAFAQGISDSYRAIRRAGGRDIPMREQLRVRYAARARRWVAALRAAVAVNRSRAELFRIRSRVACAYARGYVFHQREVATDGALLGWVLKDSYLT